MRVSEAAGKIAAAQAESPEIFRQKVEQVLDSVWLTAYEEGRDGTFEPPPHGNINVSHGLDQVQPEDTTTRRGRRRAARAERWPAKRDREQAIIETKRSNINDN